MSTMDMRVLGNALVASGVLSWLITASFGVQSVIGSMLCGVLPGLVLGFVAWHRDRERMRKRE